MRTELREAAAAYRDAPRNLRDAIVKAAQDGSTSAEIAVAIDLTYGPDYISKLIRQAGVARKRGRRKPDPSPGSPAES